MYCIHTILSLCTTQSVTRWVAVIKRLFFSCFMRPLQFRRNAVKLDSDDLLRKQNILTLAKTVRKRKVCFILVSSLSNVTERFCVSVCLMSGKECIPPNKTLKTTMVAFGAIIDIHGTFQSAYTS